MSKRVSDSGQPETASMEQVRELLFGAQLKDMEIRFQRQEERFRGGEYLHAEDDEQKPDQRVKERNDDSAGKAFVQVAFVP